MSKKTRLPFKVGDRVRVEFGRRKLVGEVVVDFGPLGIGGRRLYRVSLPMDPFEPEMLSRSEEELEAVQPGTERAEPLDKQMMIDYLRYGGLVSILRSGIVNGKQAPRVWLRPNNVGHVTHTFAPERGVAGGAVIPARALRDSKVAAAQRAAVVSFVESFGLSRSEAEAVVEEVGMAF